MSSTKTIGIEEARKVLGDLVALAQQGTDVILTHYRRPVARLTAYQEDTMTTIASLAAEYAVQPHEIAAFADLGTTPQDAPLDADTEAMIREAWAQSTASDEAEHGILTDYTTGAELRPATAAEHARSLAAGETGAFELDGRIVFVAGGPEHPSIV